MEPEDSRPFCSAPFAWASRGAFTKRYTFGRDVDECTVEVEGIEHECEVIVEGLEVS